MTNPMAMSANDFGMLFGYDQRKVGCCGVEDVGRRTFNPQPDPPAVMGGHGHHGHHGGGRGFGGGGGWGYPYGIDPLFGMQDTPIVLNQYFPSVAQGVQGFNAYGVGDAASALIDLGGAAMTSAQTQTPGALLGAAQQAIQNAIGSGGAPTSMPWLDPAKIGAFAATCFGLGMQRQLNPWDIGPGLCNSDGPTGNKAALLHEMATNLLNEVLMSRRDLSGAYSLGQDSIAPDGTMPEEVEAACFMFAQTWGVMTLPTQPISAAQVYDLGSMGNDMKQNIRAVVQQLIVNLPAPNVGIPHLAMATSDVQRRIASATNVNVKPKATSPALWIIGAAVASKLLGFI